MEIEPGTRHSLFALAAMRTKRVSEISLAFGPAVVTGRCFLRRKLGPGAKLISLTKARSAARLKEVGEDTGLAEFCSSTGPARGSIGSEGRDALTSDRQSVQIDEDQDGSVFGYCRGVTSRWKILTAGTGPGDCDRSAS